MRVWHKKTLKLYPHENSPSRTLNTLFSSEDKLNDNDRKILQRAINSSVDEVTEEYSIGKRIEENVRDNMPSISLIEKEVQEQIQRRPRMHR